MYFSNASFHDVLNLTGLHDLSSRVSRGFQFCFHVASSVPSSPSNKSCSSVSSVQSSNGYAIRSFQCNTDRRLNATESLSPLHGPDIDYNNLQSLSPWNPQWFCSPSTSLCNARKHKPRNALPVLSAKSVCWRNSITVVSSLFAGKVGIGIWRN